MSQRCQHKKKLKQTTDGRISCQVKGRNVDVKNGRCQARDCSLKQ